MGGEREGRENRVFPDDSRPARIHAFPPGLAPTFPGSRRNERNALRPARTVPPPDPPPAFPHTPRRDRPPLPRQLTLRLGTPPPATFDNFFAASNHELVTRLRELEGALAAGPVADRTFYVWGEPGSGRSHLLHALVHEATGRARFLSPQSALT